MANLNNNEVSIHEKWEGDFQYLIELVNNLSPDRFEIGSAKAAMSAIHERAQADADSDGPSLSGCSLLAAEVVSIAISGLLVQIKSGMTGWVLISDVDNLAADASKIADMSHQCDANSWG